MNLDEAMASILDAIREAVELETQGGTMAEVSSVVLGARARPMPELPAAWIVPDQASMDRDTYGDENWNMPVSLAVIVKNDDAEQGGKDARRLAALARSAALRLMDVERGNMIEGADVVDIVSVSFDPTARSSEANRTLHWCEAVVRVTFTVTE